MPQTLASIDTTIVVCTCSRAILLRGALGSLLQQDWASDHNIELLVIDDGSTDSTPHVLSELAACAPFPLRVLPGPKLGIAAARNQGFFEARGQWIASFDDDQIAPPGWLRSLRERADREHAACVGGSLTLIYPSGTPELPPGPRVRSVLGEHKPYPGAQRYTSGFHPATNNALLLRSSFLNAGGFRVAFTEGGEDKDLFQRVRDAGHPMWFEPAATAGHITPRSRLEVSNLRWTSVRLGVSDARLALSSSRAVVLRMAAVRIGASVRDIPMLLSRSPARCLDARCSLWYTQGFFRGLLALVNPNPAGKAFLESLNFRSRNGERATLAPATYSS